MCLDLVRWHWFFLYTKYTQTVVLFPALQYHPDRRQFDATDLVMPFTGCSISVHMHIFHTIRIYITNLYSSLHLWPHKHSTCLCDSGDAESVGCYSNFPLRVVFFFNRFPFMNNIKNLFHNKLFISRIMCSDVLWKIQKVYTFLP